MTHAELVEELMAAAVPMRRRFLEMDDESFTVMRMACVDEILRSMDEGDLVGELRGRVLQGICDSVARHRP